MVAKSITLRRAPKGGGAPTPPQADYAAGRAAWRAEFEVWLDERELPGWPLNDAHAETLRQMGWRP